MKIRGLLTAIVIGGGTVASVVALAVPRTERDRESIAVIVHPESRLTDMSFRELRKVFLLERQFLPGGNRILLLLRKSGSLEQSILLDKLYGKDPRGLRKYWVQKLFAGDIQAIPSVAKTSRSAIGVIRRSRKAVSVVRADETFEGVRVLKIDGKDPGDPEYPLAASFNE